MEEELSLILRFLDLEDPKKQAEFLTAHRGEVTDKFLTSVNTLFQEEWSCRRV